MHLMLAVVPCHHLVWYDDDEPDETEVNAVVPCHHLVWYDMGIKNSPYLKGIRGVSTPKKQKNKCLITEFSSFFSKNAC